MSVHQDRHIDPVEGSNQDSGLTISGNDRFGSIADVECRLPQ